MDEYVSKEAFIKRFEGMNMSWVLTMLDIFKEFPAADVEPVRHGRWKGEGMGDYSCSLCCEVVCGDEHNYCPNCGAQMNLEVSDD